MDDRVAERRTLTRADARQGGPDNIDAITARRLAARITYEVDSATAIVALAALRIWGGVAG